jgi:hypothetical protein
MPHGIVGEDVDAGRDDKAEIEELMPSSRHYVPTLEDRKIINFNEWRRVS